MNNIETIMGIIKDQFLEVMSSDPDYYKEYDIILSNEQQYIKNRDKKPNGIYIVVKFIPGSLNFGQNVIPVNINALGEGNKLEACQRLLLEYAQQFNLGEPINISSSEEDSNSYIIKQVYTQPQVMSNFNPSWNEFRSLFFMTGTFLIGKNSVPIKEINYFATESETGNGTPIDFINSSWDFSIQLDSQGFYGTDSRTRSESKIGTLSLSLVTYSISNAFCNKVRCIAWNKKGTGEAPNGIKEDFFFTVKFADGMTAEKVRFKLVNVTSPQNIGEFPLLTMTFTN